MSTTGFAYRKGVLTVEDVPLPTIAAAVGTPTYVYSGGAIVDAYRELADAFAGEPVTICYALKANDALAVVATLAREGAGADVVSGGELAVALAAGIPAERIVFSGVGKTRPELAEALRHEVLQINVESEGELLTLAEVARAAGRTAPVALRVNPDVDARTLDGISTGRARDKFGVAWTEAPRLYRMAQDLEGVNPVGIAVHIGSQIMDLAPYETAFTRVAGLVRELGENGIHLRRADLGGGLGIVYEPEVPPSAKDYAAIVRRTMGDTGLDLILEPGRRLVGPAGVLLTRVITVKDTGTRRFVVVDAAMNDLLRPALYKAFHPIRPIVEPCQDVDTNLVDIVGPVCESTDTFATDRRLAPVVEGDLLVIEVAGAYSAVMASEYNTRPRAAEVMVNGGAWSLARDRRSVSEMIAAQSLPPWLEENARA